MLSHKTRRWVLSLFIFLAFAALKISAQTWSALTRLCWNSGESVLPRIAVDSGSGVHVIWEDDTPGNGEIFYKNRK